MISIKNKSLCSGCGACINTCSSSAISFQEDNEGFIYPQIDTNKCRDCGLCEKTCPMLVSPIIEVSTQFPQFFAGQLIEKKELLEVSSGGAAWALSLAIIEMGGVVYGAKQINVDTIEHTRATTIEEAKELRRSKYFQSDTKHTFKQVKKDLQTGKVVLYCGTGCQIAGLKAYLRYSYDNLFTCDVVCHGVPSRKVWKSYRKEKEDSAGKTIKDLIFRDKSKGWSQNQYKIIFSDGSIEKERSLYQTFHAGYLSGLFYRPSCGNCKYAQIPRVSDITLADYWKYKGQFHNKKKDLGVSLIVINTTKGDYLLTKSKSFMEVETTTKELALDSCRHLHVTPQENPQRSAFFELFFKNGYHNAIKSFIPKKKNIVIRIINKIYRPCRK